jgi:hypothetical protein
LNAKRGWYWKRNEKREMNNKEQDNHLGQNDAQYLRITKRLDG